MTQKKAHEVAEELREETTVIYLDVVREAALILDYRVVELEAETERLNDEKTERAIVLHTFKNRVDNAEERIREFEAQRDKQDDVMKEQVEIAYRAGIEDGWMNPEGNMDNMTYEYMKYLEAK